MLNGRLIKIYSSLVGWSGLIFLVRLYLLFFGAPAFGKRIRYGQISKVLGYKALNGRRVLDIGGAPGVRFVVTDVYEFFEDAGYDDYFDIVFCLDVLEHVPDDTGLLSGIYGSLKEGGVMVIASPSRDRRINPEDEKIHGHVRPGYERNEMEDLLLGAGFIIEYFQYRDRLDLAYWYYRLKPDILKPLFFPAVYFLSVMFDLFYGSPARGSRVFVVGRKTVRT